MPRKKQLAESVEGQEAPKVTGKKRGRPKGFKVGPRGYVEINGERFPCSEWEIRGDWWIMYGKGEPVCYRMSEVVWYRISGARQRSIQPVFVPAPVAGKATFTGGSNTWTTSPLTTAGATSAGIIYSTQDTTAPVRVPFKTSATIKGPVEVDNVMDYVNVPDEASPNVTGNDQALLDRAFGNG